MQLALGTVQFGLAYGIAGRPTAVPPGEVRRILEEAAAAGVRVVDTAAAYGDIEERLASLIGDLPLQVVSKVAPIAEDLSPAEAARSALASARLSHSRLGVRLTALLVHRPQDLLGSRGDAVWPCLAGWARDAGVTLGASCYSPQEAMRLASERGIAQVQLPGSALDQRLTRAEVVLSLQRVQVHLRSAFLQGLLLMPQDLAGQRLPAAREALSRWHSWANARRLPLLDAALSVVKSFKAVSTVVVGVDSLAHWREIAQAWQRAHPLEAPELASFDAAVIDPRSWRVAA